MQGRVASQSTLGDGYLTFLGLVLFGYAAIGKGFAYIGVPPLFIGEACAVAGLVALLLSRRFVLALTELPHAVLALCMGWVILRTVPYIGTYGLDALRDSVIVTYGLFAFVVAALMLADPTRLDAATSWYPRVAVAFLFTAPVCLILTRYAEAYLPRMPFGSVPVILLKSGDAGVHFAALLAAVILGLVRLTPLRILAAMTTFALVATDSRGGLLTIAVVVTMAALFAGRLRALFMAGVAVVGIFLAIAAAETLMPTDASDAQARRTLSATQLIDNVASIFTKSDSKGDVEGTKEWRLLWWSKIVDGTLNGPLFWTGRGFGLNLAEADGFLGTESADRPPLRSPHSAHMTMLARGGVPGLALWVATLAVWLVCILHAAFTAWRRHEVQWFRWLIFLACYGAAFVINASFDVALEGPMQGIWFWCVYGTGVAAAAAFQSGYQLGGARGWDAASPQVSSSR